MKLRARAWLILARLTLAGAGIGASFAAPGRAHDDAGDSLPFKVESAPLQGVASFRTTTIFITTFPYTSALKVRSSGPYTYRWLDWSQYDGSITVTQDYRLIGNCRDIPSCVGANLVFASGQAQDLPLRHGNSQRTRLSTVGIGERLLASDDLA